MTQPSSAPLARKLGIKPGFSVLLINAPATAADKLRPLPEAASLSTSVAGEFDAVLAFALNRAELDEASPRALAAIKPGGLLWMAYPKQSAKVPTDITRDRGWDVIKGAGWQPVSQVAIDETWSALRFRPEAETTRRAGTVS